MKRDYKLFLRDVILAMDSIEDFVEGTTANMTEAAAVEKYGATRFTEMLAGIDANYEVVDLDMCEEFDESMDGDFDSGMASAGFGTDEDYGYYGGDYFDD